ncbi:MAG: MoxR family ATPase [Candidatus Nomurabacteria bacterium]|nr:MoxR family ATPase [Candidatus Nomurabacteria bacterium]
MATNYLFSKELAAFLQLAEGRLRSGLGAVLLLEGEPGGGKTAFAKAVAARLGGTCHYYSGSPDKERDLLYEIDVQGVLTRQAAWVPGPAWRAFQESAEGAFSVLLVDEVDKTNPGFDAFLLRLLEDFTFRAPDGREISANPAKLAVVITTNGRRKLRPEVMRRCQRVNVPLPTGERLEQIIRGIAQCDIPEKLLQLAIRLGDAVRKADCENGPSPKELAFLCQDCLSLAAVGETDQAIWRAVGASWLVKNGGAAAVDKAVSFAWAKSLATESQRH